jgi:hypothetical protein
MPTGARLASRVRALPREEIRRKLEHAATKAGVDDSELDTLESTLTALPQVARSHTQALLNGIQLQAADDFPAMAFVAKYVLTLAQEIWDSEPMPVPPALNALAKNPEAVG